MCLAVAVLQFLPVFFHCKLQQLCPGTAKVNLASLVFNGLVTRHLWPTLVKGNLETFALGIRKWRPPCEGSPNLWTSHCDILGCNLIIFVYQLSTSPIETFFGFTSLYIASCSVRRLGGNSTSVAVNLGWMPCCQWSCCKCHFIYISSSTQKVIKKPLIRDSLKHVIQQNGVYMYSLDIENMDIYKWYIYIYIDTYIYMSYGQNTRRPI